MVNPLHDLARLGQSIWLDQLTRDWLPETLQRFIEQDAVSGVTTNPAIFQQALASSAAYDEALHELGRHTTDPCALLDGLFVADIQRACDVLLPVYEASHGRDGYVSHEVSPLLAHDTQATINEARRLWQVIARPNVLIKIPATPAGIAALRQCLAEGIQVNATLLFSLEHYEAVAEAYLAALEERLRAGLSLTHVASVASFFVSRVDGYVDAELERRLAELRASATERHALAVLRGRSAVANCRLAYEHFTMLLASERCRRLAQHGARPQRLLWASTSTKNPAYSDVKYVAELAGPLTINTMPLATLAAFRDHGRVQDGLTGSADEARHVASALAEWGIDLAAVGELLQQHGVEAFAHAYRVSLEAVKARLALIADASS